MDDTRADIKADVWPVRDRGERLSSMEPLLLSESSRHREALSDLVLELVSASAGFRRSLPSGVVAPLADLVRAMNCYYSNLIEGHATHPVDIEKALAGEYSHDPKKRDLQFEARAHITVQAGSMKGICAAKRRRWLAFVTCTFASVNCCRTNCSLHQTP